MQTHILEQIATIDSLFEPAPLNETKKHDAYSGQPNLFTSSMSMPADGEETIYFINPEIEDIVSVVRNIPLPAEIVVLNSDIADLVQIRTYIVKSKKVKTAFIIDMDEIGELKCWNLNLDARMPGTDYRNNQTLTHSKPFIGAYTISTRQREDSGG